MNSVNKLILIGRLGAAPDIKTAISGSKYAVFSVATNCKKKERGTDNYVDDTQWHAIMVVSTSLIAYLEKGYLGVGDPVYLEGRLEYKQSQNGGLKKSAVVLIDSYGTLISLKTNKGTSTDHTEHSFATTSMVDDEIPF